MFTAPTENPIMENGRRYVLTRTFEDRNGHWDPPHVFVKVNHTHDNGRDPGFYTMQCTETGISITVAESEFQEYFRREK